MNGINLRTKRIAPIILILLFILLSPFGITAQDALGQRNTLNLWDAVDGTLLQTIETEAYIWQAMLNSDGTVIVAVHDGGILASYDAQTGDVLHMRTFTTAAGRRPAIRSGFEPGQVFVLQNEQFWLWEFVADEILLEGSTEAPLADILVSPDGQRFLAVTQQDQVIVLDTANGDTLTSIPQLPRIWDIKWSPDSVWFAVAHHEGFNMFDSETGANLFSVQDDRFSDVYSKVSWSPDGVWLLALASHSLHKEDTEIFAIESKTLTHRFSIQFDTLVFSLDWNAESSSILTASYSPDGVSVHDVPTGDLVHSYSGDSSTDGFLSAGWNHDGTLVVGRGVTTQRGDVYTIWEAETGQRVQERVFPDSLVNMVWDGQKSRVLFTVWPSSTVDIIDLTKVNAPLVTLVHKDTLQGAVWSTDGSRILTWTGQDMG